MPFQLRIPYPGLAAFWRVKIRDNERNEEPHVSVISKRATFRFGLRSRVFLDSTPDPRGVPKEIIELLLKHMDELTAEWDRMYPNNPVASAERSDD